MKPIPAVEPIPAMEPIPVVDPTLPIPILLEVIPIPIPVKNGIITSLVQIHSIFYTQLLRAKSRIIRCN